MRTQFVAAHALVLEHPAFSFYCNGPVSYKESSFVVTNVKEYCLSFEEDDKVV